MTLKAYKFRPGINKENTDYSTEGGWWNMQWVRFRSGTPEKMGGWAKYSANLFIGVCRGMFRWVSLSGERLMALGTHLKLEMLRGADIFDITPAMVISTLDNPISTTDGSATVRVDCVSHNTQIGSFIVISGCTAVGGVSASLLNKEHVVTAIPSADYFEIEVSAPATSTVNNGGGTNVVVEVLLVNGVEYASGGPGWGAGGWGRSTWGSGVDVSATSRVQLRLWIFDNFGENLVANVRGGQLFYWTPALGYSSANKAIPFSRLPGASDTPLFSNFVTVTDERHVVAYGTNAVGETFQDPLLIRWSDQEDPAMWTPTATNSAGDLRVPLGSYIVAAAPTRQETLVFTDASLHSLQYIGAPYTFSLQTLSSNSTLISPNAVITVNNVTYWMGLDKFYAYSGRVETLPCSLRRYVFSDINMAQALQTYVGHNEEFGEILWHYCSANSNSVDRYVIFNYLENIWYYGQLVRSANCACSIGGGIFMAGYDGYVYQHEVGNDDGSTNPPSPIFAYIESSDFDIDDGDKFSFIKRIIPDITFDGSSTNNPKVTFTLKARNFPGSAFDQSDSRAVERVASAPVDSFTNQLWIRVRGRQASFRVESNDLGVMWQLGTNRLDLRPDGRR
jgi:hypothetical protein